MDDHVSWSLRPWGMGHDYSELCHSQQLTTLDTLYVDINFLIKFIRIRDFMSFVCQANIDIFTEPETFCHSHVRRKYDPIYSIQFSLLFND